MIKLIFRTVSQPAVQTPIGMCDVCHYGCNCGAMLEYELEVYAELDPDPWDFDCSCECECDELAPTHRSYVCGYEHIEDFAEHAPEELRNVFKEGYLTINKDNKGNVYGYISCICSSDITDNQIRMIKKDLTDQLSDGIGEGLEQTQVMNAYYISWSNHNFELIDVEPVASNK